VCEDVFATFDDNVFYCFDIDDGFFFGTNRFLYVGDDNPIAQSSSKVGTCPQPKVNNKRKFKEGDLQMDDQGLVVVEKVGKIIHVKTSFLEFPLVIDFGVWASALIRTGLSNEIIISIIKKSIHSKKKKIHHKYQNNKKHSHQM